MQNNIENNVTFVKVYIKDDEIFFGSGTFMRERSLLKRVGYHLEESTITKSHSEFLLLNKEEGSITAVALTDFYNIFLQCLFLWIQTF